MLFKKMIRDLWKNKVQFGAIFIMMFLGVFIFSGISSEYHGLEVALNNYIKENNLADAWLYQKEFSDSTLNELKKQTDYEQRMYVSTSNKAVDNSNIDLYITDSNKISTLKVVNSKSFNNQDDGIWLDAMYAKKNGYRLNDQITLKYQNFELSKKIIGLVYSPENIYLANEEQLTPNRQKYGFAYVNNNSFPNTLYHPNQLVLSSKKDISKIVDQLLAGNEYKLILLDLKVGDIIKWKGNLDHQEYQSKISLIIRTPNIQGITIMKEEYLQTGHQYYPTAIIGSKNQDCLTNLTNISSIQYQQDLLESFDVLLEAMILIIIILVLGAIILGGIILYNLGVLSYLERYYEFSTLKVLGFKDTQIQKILVQQNIWLSMIGILLGLPVGYLLIEYMISTIQDTMDVINFIALPSYLYAILGTLVISWVISKIISLRIKHIDMVSSLKAND